MMRKHGSFWYITSVWVFFLSKKDCQALRSQEIQSSISALHQNPIYKITENFLFLPCLNSTSGANGQCHNLLYNHICIIRFIIEDRTIHSLKTLSTSSKSPSIFFFLLVTIMATRNKQFIWKFW